MINIKYCPNCQKELSESEPTCPDCGFEFTIIEKKVETNAKVKGEKYDPVPGWLWSVIGFIVPVIGFILYFVFKQKWPFRSENSKDGAILGLICWAIAIIFFVIFVIL